jgi:3-hydroxy-9,10-secoandrosta-1,3,5(10)-triene-9,17-dione monooxygenase
MDIACNESGLMSEALAKAAPATRPPDSGAYRRLVERARDLVPALRERAAANEANRGLLPETLSELHEAGLFRFLQPQRVGGAELDYVALVDLGAEIARGDASVAWVVTNLASHHWMLAMWPQAAQDLLWGADPDVLIASSFVFPAGKAERVAGGYKLSGRWPFSSGVDCSTWNMLAGQVRTEDGGAPEHRIFLVPESDYQMLDTWHASGLAGTASHDVVIEEAFVAEEMTVSVAGLKGGPTPGAAANPSPLYRIPVFALFPHILTGPALGNAEAVLQDFTAAMRGRVSNYSGASLAQFQTMQMRIAEAGTRLDAARLTMRAACLEAAEEAGAGIVPDMDRKLAIRRDAAFAVGLCTEAVDILYRAAGARALYTKDSLQRRFRDAHAVAAHISFNFDVAGPAWGRIALGLEADNPTL